MLAVLGRAEAAFLATFIGEDGAGLDLCRRFTMRSDDLPGRAWLPEEGGAAPPPPSRLTRGYLSRSLARSGRTFINSEALLAANPGGWRRRFRRGIPRWPR